jgi:hypothetical protein
MPDGQPSDSVEEYERWWAKKTQRLPYRKFKVTDTFSFSEDCYVCKEGVRDFLDLAWEAYKEASALEPKLVLQDPPDKPMSQEEAEQWYEHYKSKLAEYRESEALKSKSPDRPVSSEETKGRKRKPRPKKPLSGSENDILDTLYDMKAFDPDSRQTRADIYSKVRCGGVDDAVFKGPVVTLKKRGLVQTLVGSGGGCWLTKRGIGLVARRRSK